jgi:hypothetical protein
MSPWSPNPLAVIERLYQRLELGDFETVRDALAVEMKRRGEYRVRATCRRVRGNKELQRSGRTF